MDFSGIHIYNSVEKKRKIRAFSSKFGNRPKKRKKSVDFSPWKYS